MKYPLLFAAALAVTLFSARAEEPKKDTYTLTTCVVSGEKLGEMGDPYIFQYEGREVRFCCKKYGEDFPEGTRHLPEEARRRGRKGRRAGIHAGTRSCARPRPVANRIQRP